MSSNNSGAVFFLGTRAHYQVLQQPERYDVENGNASTESIYQNQSVRIWNEGEMDASGNYIGERNKGYCDNDNAGTEDKELGNGVKRRTKRRQSETASLCDRDIEMTMAPAALNNTAEIVTPKSKPSRRRLNVLAYLASFGRRKRRLDNDQVHYLQHLQTALTTCTYRESCRCLDCQSRYFECDESEYSSNDSENDDRDYDDYNNYNSDYNCNAQYYVGGDDQTCDEDDSDDEVFIDRAPGETTSTDMLIEDKPKINKPPIEQIHQQDSDALELEVAAGTPVFLNYLLTHPITCAVQ